MTTREAAIGALFTRLCGAYAFTQTTRRLASPETIAAPGEPALALVPQPVGEIYHAPSPNVPPIRKLALFAIVYVDAGADPNEIPETLLNPIKDAIDAALVADNPTTGRCTLGGLVYSVRIQGNVEGAPGDKTGKGLAVIPIEIVLP
jgi:hypothetical protein